MIKKDKFVIRGVGIDPSTTRMGISFIDINIKETSNKPFKLIYVNTLIGEKLLFDIPPCYDDEGKLARCYGLARAYESLLNIYHPDIVTCESNFLSRDPSSFKALIEIVSMLRNKTSEYGKNLFMSTITPNMAKAIVSDDWKHKGKDPIREGLMVYPYLDLNGCNLDNLGNDAIDSIAINLFRCVYILNYYGINLNESKQQ